MAGLSKGEAEQRHAARRALERYYLELTPTTRQEILDLIASGKSTFVGRTSTHRSKHRVTLESGLTLTVVYSKKRKEIITVVPNRADTASVQLRRLGGIPRSPKEAR